MATQAVQRKRSVTKRGSRKRAFGQRWLDWWPFALAVAATPFAVRTAEIFPLMGLAGLHRLCLLFPFAMLAQARQLALGEHTVEVLSQTLMYGQFPLYGFLLVLLHRLHTFTAGVLSVLCLHLIAAAVAWLLLMLH